MDQSDKKHAVFMHQKAKRLAVMEHEAKMYNKFLDRSHYNRFEQLNYLAHLRLRMKIFNNSIWEMRRLRWEYKYHYVLLRMCFRPPLPWEANHYNRGNF